MDEANFLRAQWSTVVPKYTYQSAINNINNEFTSSTGKASMLNLQKITESSINDVILKEPEPKR